MHPNATLESVILQVVRDALEPPCWVFGEQGANGVHLQLRAVGVPVIRHLSAHRLDLREQMDAVAPVHARVHAFA